MPTLIVPELLSRQALVDSISDLAWMKDEQSRFVAVNRPLANLVGMKPEEMIGKTDHDYFPAAIADAYVQGDNRVMRDGLPYGSIDPIQDAAGRTRWIETIKTPVRNEAGIVVGIAGVARDITARQEADIDRLRLSTELASERDRLNDMIANVPGVVWEEMFDGSYRFVSDHVTALLGYTVAEYLEKAAGFMDIVHPEDIAAVEQTNRDIVKNGKGTHSFRMMRKDGSSVWCESHCRVIHGPSGNPIGIRGVSFDVSTRRAADNQLRASEEHFRSLANTLPAMIWTTDASGQIEFQNRGLVDFVGIEASESRGRPWTALVHPDDLERVTDAFRKGLAQQTGISFDTRYRREDGAYRDLHVEGAPRTAAGGTFAGLVGNAIDLTDRHRLERSLEQERQLAGLGRLAATIAHEINNVLMAIQPFADVIRRASSQDVLNRAADQITNSVNRGGRITHQILRFAKTSEPQSEAVSVSVLLASAAEELKTVLGPAIQLHMDVDPSIHVLADRHQMMQVLTNLATNARDAMKGAGSLTISAQPEAVWAPLAGDAGPHVHMTVRDNGPGIDPALLDRIFEPLFTTKAGGTGLGLAIVHDIIRRHGGEIYAETAMDKGAAFHIILRATDPQPGEQETPTDSLPPSVRKILLVEDDEMVSRGLSLLLEMEGAEVLTVSRGRAASDAVKTFEPDIMILDIGLPDIPGTVVLEEVRLHSPDLPVIISTGHASEIADDAGLSGPTAHLLKPYEMATLVGAIRQLVK